MQPMKIYLCDDEVKILTDLSQKVKACMPDSHIKTFFSASLLMEDLRDESCDILLLDIDMPDMSGMDVAAWLRTQEKRPLLIFVTSHDELVYDSFQYHPFGFIRKGHFEQEIQRVLDACRKELQDHMQYFHFRYEGQDIRVALSDICYFEADGNYLKLFCTQKEYRLRSTLTAVENSIGAQGFIRTHKGFLVNQSALQRLGADEIQLTDGTLLPLGKTYFEETRKQFMRYLRG